MGKCICKQIAEIAERKSCEKVHLCTGHASICGYVNIAATKETDGILVLRDAKIKNHENEVKKVDALGINCQHIVAFYCGEFEV